MSIIDRIVDQMKQKGVTAKQFCEDFKYNRNKVNDWKSGKSAPSLEELPQIAEYFCISCDYLLTGAENSPTETGAEIIAKVLKQEEIEIINKYRKLNDIGKLKFTDNLNDISDLDRYRADTYAELLPALARA